MQELLKQLPIVFSVPYLKNNENKVSNNLLSHKYIKYKEYFSLFQTVIKKIDHLIIEILNDIKIKVLIYKFKKSPKTIIKNKISHCYHLRKYMKSIDQI